MVACRLSRTGAFFLVMARENLGEGSVDELGCEDSEVDPLGFRAELPQ